MHPSHIITSEKLLKAYTGDQPFHVYLKNYFRENKKHGSRDRKEITNYCFNFFREAAAEKFVFDDELSHDIDPVKFRDSFLIQPKVFVRIRPGHHDHVMEKLDHARLEFETITEDCISFDASTKIDQVLRVGEEVIIQDINSQRTGELIRTSAHPHILQSAIWDCCAGSGGKSIMAYDLLKKIKLTVTDNRKSIIENLRERFEKAGIKEYDVSVLDLAKDNPQILSDKFDLIIVDSPCTGSGTWARNPEQLYYFKKDQIGKYAALQKRIISNVIPGLSSGGHLLYITCSVFKKENEEVVEFIKEQGLSLVEMKLLKGYEMRADTLFAALFTAH